MRLSVVLAITLSIAGASSALAGPCVTRAVDRDDPYAYAIALRSALTAAKRAVDRPKPDLTDNHDAQALAFMTTLKMARRDYDCAAAHVEPYGASRNEAISNSAQAVSLVFTSFTEIGRKEVALCRDLLDGKLSIGTFLEQVAENAAQASELWDNLPVAVMVATHAFIQYDAAGRDTGRMIFTPAQARELRKDLRTIFGDEIEGGMKAGQNSLVASAALLYDFVGRATSEAAH